MGTRPTVPAVLAVAAVLAQIAYPLLSGDALRRATVLAVVLFFAASVSHAAARFGVRWALVLVAVSGGLGLMAEAVGVGTGVPFGQYAYAGTLGPQLLGVPVLVPMAWTMMAYPCLLLGRRLAADTGNPVAVPVLGGLALASWDLFLDPQMVAAGHWTWTFPDPALPGVPGVPLTNYAGWVLVAVTMTALLHRLLPHDRRSGRSEDRWGSELVPAALLAWTWLGSALGNLAFFDRPWVASYGFIAMGLLVAPYLRCVVAGSPKPLETRR